MGKFIDMTGKRLGKWTVLERAESDKWGRARWLCRCDCGREGVAQGSSLRNGDSKGCRQRECHYAWKGGRHKQGYVVLYDPDHPNAQKGGQIFEHIKIMSEHLGRPLLPKETVHHKNGVKDDNRIENLELWSSNHPPGQRISDQVAWAKELLRQYEPTSLNSGPVVDFSAAF